MTVSVANTTVNNTWDFLRLRVNQLAAIASTQAVTVGGNPAVGNAVIQGYVIAYNVNANGVQANTYTGTWQGNTIAVGYGGTGLTGPYANGAILLGANGVLISNTIANNTGIQIVSGPGSLQIINTGVISFNTTTATPGVNSPVRTGPITLNGTDVVNALGYTPGAANNNQWIRTGFDLNYYSGNVAIGYSDGAARSAASLTILTTDTANNLPGVLIENVGNNATSGAYLNLSVANSASFTGIRFQNNRNNDGAIEYSPAIDFLRFTTANTFAGGFDAAGNFGLGTTALSPNKGGKGIHIVGTNPGLTLDNGTGIQWVIGQNPNATSVGGVRQAGQFAIFSDSSNSAILFANSSATSQISLITNGLSRVNVDLNGRVRMSSSTMGTAVLQVGGDITTEGNFNTQSDYRLKKNIKVLSEKDALSHINSLNPVTFDWKKDDRHEYGFIAHEVQLVIPTAVKGEKDGEDIQTLDKSQLTPSIVKSIQALINIVNKQQQEINRLKDK